MSRALRVRAHFFVIVSGVSCAGRRLAARQRLVSPNGSRTSNRPFPCFVDAMSFAPSAQRAAEKFYLKQGLVQAAARASGCQGQVQVNASRSARAPPARPEGTSWASQVLRRTVVTRGGRRCSQTAFSTLEFSFKCRRRRLVGRGPRLYCRGHLLARLNTHQIHQRRTATHAVSMVELSARLNAHTPSV